MISIDVLEMPETSRRSLVREHVRSIGKEFECPICGEQGKELRLFPECQHFACTGCVGKNCGIFIHSS